MNVERANNQILSGPAGVVGFAGAGCVVLPIDPQFPEGGDVRLDLADQAIEPTPDGHRQPLRALWRLHTVSTAPILLDWPHALDLGLGQSAAQKPQGL